jgi:hypothetical protein
MKTRVIILLSLLAVLSINGTAQEINKRLGFELNGGASLATSKPGNTKLNPGFGFEGLFHYRFMEHTGVYAGWGWNRFGAESSFAGNDVCFEETGYVFGLQFNHPLASTPINYYLRAGGLYNHIEIENADGEIILDSGHGFGLQLAAGFDVNLNSKWSFTPGLKFNALSNEVDNEGSTFSLKNNYLSLRIGFVRKF